MADTYTTHALLRKIEDGGQSDAWGAETNDTFSFAEDMLWGIETLTITGNYTLATLSNDTDGEARAAAFVLSGSPSADFNLTVPTGLVKPLVVYNNTGRVATVKYSASSGFAVQDGACVTLFANGTDVIEVAGITQTSIADATYLNWLPASSYIRKDQAVALGAGVAMPFLPASSISSNVVRTKITLTANLGPLSIGFTISGKAHPIWIIFKQGGSGGYTVSFSGWEFPGGGTPPTITPTVGAVDMFRCTITPSNKIYVHEIMQNMS